MIGIAVVLTDLVIGEIQQEELLIKIIITIIVSCIAFYIPVLFKVIQKTGENFQLFLQSAVFLRITLDLKACLRYNVTLYKLRISGGKR